MGGPRWCLGRFISWPLPACLLIYLLPPFLSSLAPAPPPPQAGKALSSRFCEVRVQFRLVPGMLFRGLEGAATAAGHPPANELVSRVQVGGGREGGWRKGGDGSDSYTAIL